MIKLKKQVTIKEVRLELIINPKKLFFRKKETILNMKKQINTITLSSIEEIFLIKNKSSHNK